MHFLFFLFSSFSFFFFFFFFVVVGVLMPNHEIMLLFCMSNNNILITPKNDHLILALDLLLEFLTTNSTLFLSLHSTSCRRAGSTHTNYFESHNLDCNRRYKAVFGTRNKNERSFVNQFNYSESSKSG